VGVNKGASMKYLGSKKTERELKKLKRAKEFDYAVVKPFKKQNERYFAHVYICGVWIPLTLNHYEVVNHLDPIFTLGCYEPVAMRAPMSVVIHLGGSEPGAKYKTIKKKGKKNDNKKRSARKNKRA
jgi:hypothetical protein